MVVDVRTRVEVNRRNNTSEKTYIIVRVDDCKQNSMSPTCLSPSKVAYTMAAFTSRYVTHGTVLHFAATSSAQNEDN